MASLFKRTYTVIDPHTGRKVRRKAAKWYGKYTDADGVRHRVPLHKNKTVALQMLGDLTRKDGADPYGPHRERPLAEHLTDYCRELEAKGNAPRHVRIVVSRLRALLDGCGFVFWPDLAAGASASRVSDWLAKLREKGRPRAELPAGQEHFTVREVAALLGVKAQPFQCGHLSTSGIPPYFDCGRYSC
jgi:hypothetical protein